MKKKYNCRLSASSLLVKVKGNVIRCEFEPDVVNTFGMRGCSYTTENKDIQYAIEHSARFGKECIEGIWTDDVEKQWQDVYVTEGTEENLLLPTNPEAEPVIKKKVVRRGKQKKEE